MILIIILISLIGVFSTAYFFIENKIIIGFVVVVISFGLFTFSIYKFSSIQLITPHRSQYAQAKIYSMAFSKIDNIELKVEAYVFMKKYNEQLIKAQNYNKSIWYDLLIDDDITNYRPVVLPKIK